MLKESFKKSIEELNIKDFRSQLQKLDLPSNQENMQITQEVVGHIFNIYTSSLQRDCGIDINGNLFTGTVPNAAFPSLSTDADPVVSRAEVSGEFDSGQPLTRLSLSEEQQKNLRVLKDKCGKFMHLLREMGGDFTDIVEINHPYTRRYRNNFSGRGTHRQERVAHGFEMLCLAHSFQDIGAASYDIRHTQLTLRSLKEIEESYTDYQQSYLSEIKKCEQLGVELARAKNNDVFQKDGVKSKIADEVFSYITTQDVDISLSKGELIYQKTIEKRVSSPSSTPKDPSSKFECSRSL